MVSNIEVVIDTCRNDPELTSLLDDHPYLLSTLGHLQLKTEEIFQILSAAENDNYMRNRTSEHKKQGKTHQGHAQPIEEPQIDKKVVEEVSFTQKFKVMTDTLSELRNLVMESAPSETVKQLQRENLVLKEEMQNAKEKNEFLVLERESQNETDRKLKQLEQTLEETKKEKNSWMAKAQQKSSQANQGAPLAAPKLFLILLKVSHALKQSVFSFLKKQIPGRISKSFTAQSESVSQVSQKLSKLFTVTTTLLRSLSVSSSTSLDLSSIPLSTEWLRQLLSSLSYNSPVLELNLSNNSLGDEGAYLLGEWVRKDEKLRSLSLRNNNFTEKGSSCVMDSLCLQGLATMLDLSHNEIDVHALIELVSNAHSLNDIILENCGLLGDQIRDIIGASNRSQLSGLFISYNPISNSHLKVILQQLERSRIKNWGLSGLPFEDKDAVKLVKLIKAHPDIEVLHLAHVEFLKEAFDLVLVSLSENCVDLVELDVTGTACSIRGVAKLIERSKSLKTIVLREIKVSEADYLCLAQSIEKAEQLEVCLLDT